MDFADSREEAMFRDAVRAWLADNAPRKTAAKPNFHAHYPGDDEALAAAKDFQARKAEAGYAAITWPTEWGGRGGHAIEQVIFDQEAESYAVPRGFFDIGLGMCVPTVMTYGTEQQRRRYGPPALRGEEIWCQLFSEPAAGSDLAGIRSRAEPAGDGTGDWILNGQKIWTSGAHFSDYGIIVCRHDADLPKHKGLTFFFLDMRSPGIEIRPIKQIDGGQNFNEVFFSDVRVPDSQRLGAVGEGWKVSLTTLMNERLAVGDSPPPDFAEIFELCRGLELESGPALEHGAVRDTLADWYVQTMGLKYTKFRTMTRLSRGETAGPESSITKLVAAKKLQDIGAFGMELMEQAGAITATDRLPLGGMFQDAYFIGAWRRIAGGTDEILRNIIAERVLKLPGDIRVDKETAFRHLPAGKG